VGAPELVERHIIGGGGETVGTYDSAFVHEQKPSTRTAIEHRHAPSQGGVFEPSEVVGSAAQRDSAFGELVSERGQCVGERMHLIGQEPMQREELRAIGASELAEGDL